MDRAHTFAPCIPKPSHTWRSGPAATTGKPALRPGIPTVSPSVAMLALTTETDPANYPIRREFQLPANRTSTG
jgi:hypothetical protein